MFMSDVHKKDEIKNIATQDLRKFGIKCRPKKTKQHVQVTKSGNRVFNVPLSSLSTETVTLRTGQQIVVSKLVHELCSFILTKVDTEGLFRKEGSKARQNEIKLVLDAGCSLEDDHHVIDVAVVLKTFLRQLPEPLIPYGYHELFLRCVLLEQNKLEAILLACLLLPLEHLNALSYLMQFFYEVAEHSKKNKMTPYNLAVVIGPTVFPVDEKLSPNPQLRTTKTCELFKLLIENARSIGVLPENIIDRVGSISSLNNEQDKKKKKRRSGSLTRMFNGLKKIVGGKSGDEIPNIVTPDLLLTPINRSLKKRKVQTSAISNKKKKELISKLPENTLLSTPFTPCRTPVNMNLSGTNEKRFNNSNDFIKEKKSQWFSRSRSVKNLKHEETESQKGIPKNALERRWSVVSQVTNIKNKKRNSCAASLSRHKQTDVPKNVKSKETNFVEPDYVRVPKFEYEEFINKVSAIERRISSFELQNVQSQIKTDNENNSNVEVDSNIKSVQTAYEQTLVQAKPLSPTTDQLAKRLSRDLKIRRSAEQKIIRSPSARKIGSMRRRSRELEKNNSKVVRHKSWHVATKETIPRVNLKRGKPNTVLTGLPATSKLDYVVDNVLETKEIKRTTRSSFNGQINSGNEVSCNLSGSSSDKWVSAEGFFGTVQSNDSNNSLNDRASLAKLRSQNAGMVLAKAKLFDKLKDSESSNSSFTGTIPRAKIGGNKIGSTRNVDPKLSYRVRALRYEERRLNKKSMSPRRRNGSLTQKQKLQIAKQYADPSFKKNDSDKENLLESFGNLDKNQTTPLKDCNRIDGQEGKPKILSPKYMTPKATPQIKRPLNVRSPKRLCRTPGGLERNTPLKVLVTPIYSQL